MTKYLLSFLTILFILLLVASCKKEKNNKLIYYSYEDDKSMCNRILIFSQDSLKGYSEKPHPNYSLFAYYPFNNKEIYEITGTVKQFDSLLRKGKKTGYCCCPQTNYKISFYNKTDEFDNYYVDTIELKDTIRIYQKSFQFSYLIEKEKWKIFLSKAKKIAYKEYKSNNLILARKIFKESQKNNLPILTSHNVSGYWMHFDGKFEVEITSNKEKLNENVIVREIKDKFPNSKFLVDLYQTENEEDENNNILNSKIRAIIYCNRNLYDIFNIFKTRKYQYYKSDAQFLVLGTTKKLEEFNLILEKENLIYKK